jgi:hypothetical protein
MAATVSPTVVTRAARARSACACCSAASVSFRSAMASLSSVEGGKLFGSLCDTLLELLIQLCYFLFGLLESGRFDDLPVLVSLGDCALMGARHVKDVGRAGHRKRVGAQHRHRSAGHRPIELHFVFVKVSPNALVQPERIADDPQSFVPFGQRMSQFLIPNDSHPFSIEATVCEI